MNTFLRKTTLFCLSIVGIIFCSAYVQLKTYPNEELEILKNALPDTDVIFFGSSVNWYSAKKDADKRKISEMLDSLLVNEVVTDISHGAYNSEIYLEFVKFICKNKSGKLLLIVPINLRYFSPPWDLRPKYQFIKERYEISGIPYLINFKNYKRVSNEEYESCPVYFHGKKIGDVGSITQYKKQEKDRAARNGFILHYMQPINSNHRKLKALKKIVDLCEKNQIDLMTYITPIDIEKAETLNLKGFRKKVLENLSVIKENLEIESWEILDMSFYLESKHFDYKKIPNEHLNMHGRRKVAKRIKKKLTQLGYE